MFPLQRGALLLGLLTGALLAAGARAEDWRSPPWRRPAAVWRLFTFAVQSLPHTLHVSLPAAAADGVDAEAFSGERPLPCRPVQVGGRLVAVEVAVDLAAAAQAASWRGLPGALEIYVFRERQERAPAVFPLMPVTLRAAAEKAVARPANGREYLQYGRQRPALAWRRELTDFPGPENLAELALLQVPEHQLRLQFSALWRVEAETSVEFAIANPVCGAWFLLYDGRPAFSWGECAVSDDLPVSAPLACTPGLHRLDFCVMVEPGEAFPQLRFRERQRADGFGLLPAEALFSVNAALAVCMEGRRDLLSPGLRLDPVSVLAFAGTDTRVSLVRVSDFSQPWAGQSELTRRLRVDGLEQELPAGGGIVAFPGRLVNQTSLRVADRLGSEAAAELPFRLDWTGAMGVRAGLSLRGLPLLAPAEGPCRVRYEVSLTPAWRSTLEEQLQVVLREYDRAGQLGRFQGGGLPRSPFARELDLPLDLPAGSRLEVSLELAGLPVCAPLRIYPVAPGDELAFGPSADQLRYADGFGVLRRPAEPAGAVADWVAAPRGAAVDVVLVDDFVANAPHFQEPYAVADWTWGGRGHPLRVTHLPLASRGAAGQHPVLDKFAALARAVAAKPKAIVWAVGMADLRGGMDRRDYRSQLVFVLEACRRRGQPLVLVALPVDGTVEAEHVRACALAVKELGLKYRVPVADLYSASLRHGGLGPYYGFQGQPGQWSATPNAAGRQWCFRELNTAVVAWAWPGAGEP